MQLSEKWRLYKPHPQNMCSICGFVQLKSVQTLFLEDGTTICHNCSKFYGRVVGQKVLVRKGLSHFVNNQSLYHAELSALVNGHKEAVETIFYKIHSE